MKLPSDMGPDPQTLAEMRRENELIDSLPPKLREALKTSIGCLTFPQIEELAARYEAGMLNVEYIWQQIEQADQRLRPGTKLGYTPVLVKRGSPRR